MPDLNNIYRLILADILERVVSKPTHSFYRLHPKILSTILQGISMTTTKGLEKYFSNPLFIQNVCLSYRHDFGLLNEEERKRIEFECKEWMRAIVNNWGYSKYDEGGI